MKNEEPLKRIPLRKGQYNFLEKLTNRQRYIFEGLLFIDDFHNVVKDIRNRKLRKEDFLKEDKWFMYADTKMRSLIPRYKLPEEEHKMLVDVLEKYKFAILSDSPQGWSFSDLISWVTEFIVTDGVAPSHGDFNLMEIRDGDSSDWKLEYQEFLQISFPKDVKRDDLHGFIDQYFNLIKKSHDRPDARLSSRSTASIQERINIWNAYVKFHNKPGRVKGGIFSAVKKEVNSAYTEERLRLIVKDIKEIRDQEEKIEMRDVLRFFT